jgi:nitrile hydratase subunit beta
MSASYFERHLTAVATLLVEKGLTTREELEVLAGGSFQLSKRRLKPTSAGSSAEAFEAVGRRSFAPLAVRDHHRGG